MNVESALRVSQQTLLYLVPELIVAAAAVVIFTAGAFVARPRRFWCALSALVLLAGLAALPIATSLLAGAAPDPYRAVVSNDWLAFYARAAALVSGLILLALAHNQIDDARAPEYFGCLLLIVAGAMLSCCANELVLLFVGLELVSIPTYVLLYLGPRDDQSQEAAAKYFYLSIFSSALLLFGLAYLYGLTGLSNLRSLQYLVHWNGGALQLPQPQLALVALVFVTAGLGFRIAAAPFHFYAPDAYQGAPTVTAALLAWVPKLIGGVALLRVLSSVFGWAPAPGETSNLVSISDKSVLLTAILAVITMTWGNTVALAQDDLKRLLAYSSIAHAGYLLVGVAAAFRDTPDTGAGLLGADAVIFYLASYALMTLGAFGVIVLLHTPERPAEKIDDLSGLWTTRRWPALALVLCLFSLAGIPPMLGFWAKFRIFQSALESARGADARTFQLLTVIGVVNAAIGAYYYLRIIVFMMFRPPLDDHPPPQRAPWPTAWAVAACAGLSLLLGFFPNALGRATRDAGQSLVASPDPAATQTQSTLKPRPEHSITAR